MIDPKILNEIEVYCDMNNININTLINKIISRGFSIEKYGETPNKINKEPEKVVEYVEIEKPVEVEKIVRVSDDEKVSKLLDEIENKSKECDEKIKKLESENKYLREKIDKHPTDLYGE